MTFTEIFEAFDFIEKEDLQVWPENCIEALDRKNTESIIAYLAGGPVSGEELLILDLPAFLYPVDQFRKLWEALAKEQGKSFATNVREEEISPSDEFPRLAEKLGLKK